MSVAESSFKNVILLIIQMMNEVHENNFTDYVLTLFNLFKFSTSDLEINVCAHTSSYDTVPDFLCMVCSTLFSIFKHFK
jgi:hypothetical protein